jgi:ParB/RepB/Spo0J family partition protein
VSGLSDGVPGPPILARPLGVRGVAEARRRRSPAIEKENEMSTQTQTDPQAPQHGYTLAEIPLSRIVVSPSNPRREFDEQEIERLAHAMRTRGFDHPILVRPEEREGYFEIIDGERRWRAAQLAEVQTLPVLVKQSSDAPGSDLLDAMLANGLGVSLNVLEQALGYQALIDEGHYTRKGIAEAFQIPVARVRERLAILDLPEGLREQIVAGEVPLMAVKTLAGLAKIHAALPELAVKRVLDSRTQGWSEPITWEELLADPISILIGGYEEQIEDFPEGVFVANCAYALSSFELGEEATDCLAQLCELAETEPEQIYVHFGPELVEQALSLHAAHRSANGSEAIVVGADVANQLAVDYLAERLKGLREDEALDRGTPAEPSVSAPAEADGHSGQGEAAAAIVPPTPEQIAAAQKRAGEEDRRLRDETIAANQQLGAALVKHLATVKVDARVLKILTAAPIATSLSDIAARGARLCFPGFAQLSERKNGSTKADYPDAQQSEAKAREFLLDVASTGEVAGRLLALLAAARWANEEIAIPRSKASHYRLSLGSYYEHGVPWRNEAEELLDEILIERLPEEIAAPIAEAKARREAVQAEERRRERERDKDVRAFVKRAPELTRDERQAEIQRLRREYGFSALQAAKGRELMELPEPHEALELAAAA